MGLQSLQYCAFLVVVAAVYLHLPVRMQPVFLLGASWVFYALAMPAMLPVTIALAVFTYLCGRGLAWRGGAHKTAFLRLGVIGMLGILAFFKYNGLLGGVLHGWRAVAMPLGISFYTFQITSYLIDVYLKKIKPANSFLELGTFLCMFPQLISGPITTYGEMQPQIHQRRVNIAQLESGLETFVLGLGAKTLLANPMGGLWNNLSVIGYDSISTQYAWLGAFAYSFQIYFDFSGYSMMAIGVGQMLGFELPQNFNLPYISGSATEFWRRWHITLGRWFRNNIYIPLGGNREGRWKTLRNTFCVWAFTGLWHGASWNFVLWGLIFFVLIMLEKNIYGKLLNKTHVLKHVYIIFLIPLTWMVFAISDMHQLATYFTRLFPFLSSDTVTANTRDVMVALHNYWKILIPCVLFSTPLPLHYYKKYRKSAFCIILLIVIFILSIRAMMTQTNNPFLYFQF